MAKHRKTHRLAVKTRTYQVDGKTKNHYLNVGTVIEDENGPYILMDKTFNPSGVQDGKDSVLISMFPVDSEVGRNSPRSLEEVPF